MSDNDNQIAMLIQMVSDLGKTVAKGFQEGSDVMKSMKKEIAEHTEQIAETKKIVATELKPFRWMKIAAGLIGVATGISIPTGLLVWAIKAAAQHL